MRDAEKGPPANAAHAIVVVDCGITEVVRAKFAAASLATLIKIVGLLICVSVVFLAGGIVINNHHPGNGFGVTLIVFGSLAIAAVLALLLYIADNRVSVKL